MDKDKLLRILQSVSSGDTAPVDAFERLKTLPYEDLGFAKIDMHRCIRQGMPEVIYSPGKTSGQIAQIAKQLMQHHSPVLASRANADQANDIIAQMQGQPVIYHELARMLVFGAMPTVNKALPTVAILTAGTADLPVAEEAALVIESQGVPCLRINDVGVAGIHRLLDKVESLQSAAVTVVVAGMDGALPSVVAGLLAGPVIGVPTSIGYGAGMHGIAPLLTMLNSCAAGLTVVNIDNGFGGAVAALRLINSM